MELIDYKGRMGLGGYGNVLDPVCGAECKGRSGTFVNAHQVLHLNGGISLYVNYALVKSVFFKKYLGGFFLF